MKKDTSNLKKLVIVESPAKSKTIGKILGGDYIVTASVGHIRDLPVNSLGIKISDDGLKFTPVYEVSETKKKVVAGLVKSAKECGEIFLASDPDREGEAIAWHLKAVIDGASKTPVAGRKFHRVRYNEITPAAVRRAFENPGEIDDRVVDAQQARRVLDRLVGYKISRILWRKIRTGISAGRVQSVGLRLVCGREREVRAFTPVPYWEFDVALSKLTGETRPFKARLTQINGKKADVNDEARAAEVKAALEASACEVVSVSEQRRARKPFAPFITSTLQQSASNALGYSPNITMSIAQKLYEGVDLGGELGQTGLITYMRTDSFNVSQEARAAARDFITGAYGAEYHQDKERVYKSRDNAQGAHEAIRPTDPALTPAAIAAKLTPQEAKLYDLIWRRFIASRMSDAVSNVRMVKVAAKSQFQMTLSASSSELVFPGFTKVYGTSEPKQSDDENKDDGEGGAAQGLQAWLPPLAEGEALAHAGAGAVASERKETKPPPRFNEASLVKELEANGVGRPSTYASIISILLARKYMVRDKRALVPTDLGIEVDEYLSKHYDELFDIGFTAKMEGELDDVEDPGKSLDWQGMLAAFYRRLNEWLGASTSVDAADPDALNALIAKFDAVTEWEPRRKIGIRTYDDKQFVENVKKAGAARASRYQFDSLARMLLRYKTQVADAEEFLKTVGFSAAEPDDSSPLRNNINRLFEILDKAGVNEGATAFYQSLHTQHDIGRRLSDKQLACLERMFLESRERIDGFGAELCETLGVKQSDSASRSASRDGGDGAETVVNPEEIIALLAGLAHVGEWKKPVKRGRTTYDDVKFFQSLSAQFSSKKRLSEAQVKSLRKLFFTYRDSIPGADDTIAKFNLTPPAKKSKAAKN